MLQDDPMPTSSPDLLAVLERQLRSASSERQAQTSAFERAMERLGDRLDRRISSFARLVVGAFVVVVVLLGADRFGSFVLEGLGMRIATTAEAETTPLAPTLETTP